MPGFTTITASAIQDASGRLLTSGRVNFHPVNPSGDAASAISGGVGAGMILARSVSFLVKNGAITTDLHGNPAQVADAMLTTPVLCYRIAVLDDNGAEVQGPGYGLVQPTGATWSLDTFPPAATFTLAVTGGTLQLSPYTGPTTGLNALVLAGTDASGAAANFLLTVTDGALVYAPQ
jgi:hypothetical protein